MTESGEREIESWKPRYFDEHGTAQPLTAKETHIARAAFEAGRGQWISVEKKLPEHSDEYIVFDSECGVMAADFMVALENIRESQWRTVRSYGQDCEEQELYNVTKWQPLPAPPDSGDKKGTGDAANETDVR